MAGTNFDIISPADANDGNVTRIEREIADQYSPTPSNFITPGEFMNKLIEPEDDFEENKLNRNFQLGNINKDHHLSSQQTFTTAKFLNDIPSSQGGFLFNWMGGILLSNINFLYASSNSIDGVARRLTVTRINKQETKDTTAKGGFGSMLSKQQTQ